MLFGVENDDGLAKWVNDSLEEAWKASNEPIEPKSEAEPKSDEMISMDDIDAIMRDDF